jgi:nitrate/nitrite transporter NarK
VNSARPGFRQTFLLAWHTPLLGWILLVEIATLSYLWGSSAWLPAWLRDEHHFSLQATGLLAAIPFLLSLGSKFLGGALLDKLRPEQAPLLFIVGRARRYRRWCSIMRRARRWAAPTALLTAWVTSVRHLFRC